MKDLTPALALTNRKAAVNGMAEIYCQTTGTDFSLALHEGKSSKLLCQKHHNLKSSILLKLAWHEERNSNLSRQNPQNHFHFC